MADLTPTPIDLARHGLAAALDRLDAAEQQLHASEGTAHRDSWHAAELTGRASLTEALWWTCAIHEASNYVPDDDRLRAAKFARNRTTHDGLAVVTRTLAGGINGPKNDPVNSLPPRFVWVPTDHLAPPIKKRERQERWDECYRREFDGAPVSERLRTIKRVLADTATGAPAPN